MGLETDCVIFSAGRLSIPCAKCGEWPETPHVAGVVGYCEKHCPVCHPAAFLFPEPMPTGAVSGEQEEMF